MPEKTNYNHNSLESTLRDRLGEYTLPVGSDLWPAIQKDFQQKKRKRTQTNRLLKFFAIAVAAIIVILFIPNVFRIAPKSSETSSVFIAHSPQEIIDTPPDADSISKTKNHNISGIATATKKTQIVQEEQKIISEEQTIVQEEQTVIPKEQCTTSEENTDKKQETNNTQKPSSTKSEDSHGIVLPVIKKHRQQKLSFALSSQNFMNDERNSRKWSYSSTVPGEKETESLKHASPFNIVLSIRKELTKRLSIESGLSYAFLQTKGTTKLSGEVRGSSQYKLHYLGIPVRGVYTIYDNNNYSFYSSIGGTVEKFIAGNYEIITKYQTTSGHLNVSSLQWSLNGALGVNVRIYKRCSLFVEVGFGYYFNDKSDIPTIRQDKPFNINIPCGIRFTY